MQHIEIEATYRTPRVIFDPAESKCKIEGNSILVNVEDFYRPLLNWMDEFVKNPTKETVEVTFDIEHSNLASTKRFVFFLYRLRELQDKGIKVIVNWLYSNNDSDTLEMGEDFSQMLDIPFKFIGYEKLKKREMWPAD